MKKRRFRNQSDSLDLLLDTICNTFGGIIFIACLVMLLARESGNDSNSAVERADTDILKRRIEVAKDDLARLSNLLEQQNEKRASAAALGERKEALEREIAELRKNASVSAGATDGLPKTDDLVQLRGQLRPLRTEVERLMNAITSSEKEITRLNGRQSDLARKSAEIAAYSREKLRFPKERTQDKSPFWVILKHGRIYPLRADNGDLNETTLSWEDVDSRHRQVTPRPTEGIVFAESRAGLTSQLRSVASGKQFLAVCLFPDSYETWRDYRRIIQEVGLDYGLKFFPLDATLVLGDGGSVPPPL
ncbi:MAG TPA: hypothetical protein VG796_01290 [Verrucomicrobiales bacterium]|nr:hypothetical protein [Verrucomicrobiales bacterium]